VGTVKFVKNPNHLVFFFFCIHSSLKLLSNRLGIILKVEAKQVVLQWYIFISSNWVISNLCWLGLSPFFCGRPV